jgi:phospholipase C
MQAGLYADSAGALHATHPMAPDFEGCGFHDPDHSFNGGRIEYNSGQCDGWLRAGTNDALSIGYYSQDDLPFLGTIASQFATPARYFAPILGPTYPNRIYQQPLWGAKYNSVNQPFAKFLEAAADGNLPAVSFVDPVFGQRLTGPANDDHPLHDVRDGEVFMNTIYTAVTSGPAWPNTLLVINFDEWGGFFEHIPPPAGPVTAAEQALGYGDGLRGFRVPCIVISPWSQHQTVSRTVFDHASILKLIEWRFGLAPLTARDAQANNLAEVLDFSNPRLEAPQVSVAAGPYGGACP